MKSDDPRLEKSRKEVIERVNRVNEMIVTVLKNHLVVEQFMDDFLITSGRKPNGSFADKAQNCKSLNPPEIEAAVWTVLTRANQLRNKIAHTLDEAQIKTKTNELRDAYLAALSPKERAAAESLEDARICAAAFELCGTYLVGATIAARTGKEAEAAPAGQRGA